MEGEKEMDQGQNEEDSSAPDNGPMEQGDEGGELRTESPPLPQKRDDEDQLARGMSRINLSVNRRE